MLVRVVVGRLKTVHCHIDGFINFKLVKLVKTYYVKVVYFISFNMEEVVLVQLDHSQLEEHLFFYRMTCRFNV